MLKRQEQILAIRGGLNHVGFLKHIEEFPEFCRPVFTGETAPVSCAGFLDLLDRVKTEDRIHKPIKSWFFDYIDHSTEETLKKLLRFSTAFQLIPPWGLSRKMAVKLLDDDDENYFSLSSSRINALFASILSIFPLCIVEKLSSTCIYHKN